MSEEASTQTSSRVEEELAAVLRQVEKTPEDADANRAAGQLLGRSGRHAEAVEYLTKAVQADPLDALAWYCLSLAAGKAGELDTAQRAIEQFDRLAPADALALGRRANALGQLGEPQRAAEYAQRALDLAPDPHLRAWIRRLLANCHEDLGNREEQLRQLEASLQDDPGNARALADVAHLQERHRRPVTVLPLAERLVAQRPDDGEAWCALGAVANRGQDWWQAREALERAIELGYDTPGSRRELGAALCFLGCYRDAVAELEQALASETEAATRSWIHGMLARGYQGLKNSEKVLEQYRAAVEADPSNADAQQGLGATYVDLDDFEAALPHLKEATRLAPDAADAWYALGRVLAWRGDLERAQAALERAMALGHGDGRVQAQLAWVLQRQGRRAAAAEQARRALRKPLPKKWRGWVAGILNDCRKGPK